MSINTNVGMISGSASGKFGNVAVQGSSTNMATTTDTGSILAVKYIKNDTSEVTSPSNVGTIALKNWFAEFVGTLGNFDKSSSDNQNIKWSDYRGATILGFKVEGKNETKSTYGKNNNAAIRITPINGDTTATKSYSVQVGGKPTQTSSGGSLTFSGFDGGGPDTGASVQAIRVRDLNTGVLLKMSWLCVYDQQVPNLRGSTTVGFPGQAFAPSWSGTNKATAFSEPMYFFLGKPSTRLYGSSYS